MNSLPKICLILPYFGTLPPYWDGFINSCADNPNIDFLIISDIALTDLPDNVRFISMSWDEIKELISNRFKILGISKINLNRPYKLCDYRPCYGYLFEHELKEYDYWGHIDCDLIWGDLEKLFNQIQISKYDRVLPMGHLSLYRNSEEINKIFASPKYITEIKRVAGSSLPFNFDEAGINEIFHKEQIRFYEDRHDATFSIWDYAFRWRNFSKCAQGELFVKEANGCTASYYIDDNGSLQREEVGYIHFMTKKAIIIDKDVSLPYCIAHKGVYSLKDIKEETIKQAIEKYTLSTEKERLDLVNKEIKRFRNESRKRFINEFKSNGLSALRELFSRLKPWLIHRSYIKR